MLQFMKELQKRVVVGVVGGSDLAKIKEQLGGDDCEFLVWYSVVKGL